MRFYGGPSTAAGAARDVPKPVRSRQHGPLQDRLCYACVYGCVAKGTSHAGSDVDVRPNRQASKSHRLPVAPRVAGSHVAVDRRVPQTPDELAGPEVLVRVVDDLDAVPEVDQPLHRARVHAALDVDLQPGVEAPARRVAGGLRGLAVV